MGDRMFSSFSSPWLLGNDTILPSFAMLCVMPKPLVAYCFIEKLIMIVFVHNLHKCHNWTNFLERSENKTQEKCRKDIAFFTDEKLSNS